VTPARRVNGSHRQYQRLTAYRGRQFVFDVLNWDFAECISDSEERRAFIFAV
jgi:hypothetical protein